MKENKNGQFGKYIKKDRRFFILFNLLLFAVLLTIIGLTALFVINDVTMRDAKETINRTAQMVEARAKDGEGIDDRLVFTLSNRMMVEFLDSDDHIIKKVGMFDIIYNHSLIKDGEYNIISAMFSTTEIPSEMNAREMKLMVYSYAPNDDMVVEGSPVSRIIMYMDVTSESNIKTEIMRVYLVSVVLILLIGLVTSRLISGVLIKPITVALQKQLDFVSDASHELRTPLAIIQSKMENILSKSNSTVMEVSDDIAVSLNEVTRLNRLISSLLVLSRSDKETISIDLEECNLYEIIQSTFIPFKEMAEIQGKIVRVEGHDIIAKVDKDMISQIIIILLDNALRYTYAGDEIIIKLSQIKNDFYIQVADTGMGISEETKKKMFERFYREDKARSKETGGRGLGLAIAKALVECHKGKIFADHNIPKGTVVTIQIPLNPKK